MRTRSIVAVLVFAALAAAPALAKGKAGAGGDLALGKQVFTTNCATCHGAAGDGNGPAGAALKPKPRNFQKEAFKYGSSQAAVVKTIENGVPGSAMPAWKASLSPAKIKAAAAYVLAIHAHKVK